MGVGSGRPSEPPRGLLEFMSSTEGRWARGSTLSPNPLLPGVVKSAPPPIRLTLPPLSLESLPAQKKRLLPIHGWDFEADSDDSDPSCGHPPSLSSVSGATDGLQVSGLSFHP